MRDSASEQKSLRPILLAAAVLTLLLNGVISPAARAADPPERLTREQRKELEQLAIELTNAGVQLYQRGEIASALEKTKKGLQINERLYPKSEYPDGNTHLAVGLFWLGVMHQAEGAYGEARACLERALQMHQALYPKEQYPQGHPILARSLYWLGYVLKAQGEFGEARGYYERSLAMRQALYPKDQYPQGHSDLANILTGLGDLLNAQGAYGEAQGYFERVLVMRQGLYSKDRYPQGHTELARSLAWLGHVLKAQGEFDEARSYYEQSLAMHQTLYPKEQYPQGHAGLANILTSLGVLLRAQGAYGEAQGYFERALVMRQGLYPKDRYPQGHTELAQSLIWLGCALNDKGAHGEARGCFERALLMHQGLFPKDRYPQGHSEMAQNLGLLGYVLEAQGAYGEAQEYYERELAMNQSLRPKERFPRGYIELAKNLAKQGQLLQEHGAYGEARDYLKRALTMFESFYSIDRHPHGHAQLANILSWLGRTFEAEGAYGEAKGCFERVLAMTESLHPKEKYPHGHPDLVASLRLLGLMLWRQGAYCEARDHYERALAMTQALYPQGRYPQGHAELAECLGFLGALLHEQGSRGNARAYLERALTMYQSLYPAERYPQGHAHIAVCMENLGRVLHEQGASAEARGNFERALTMNQSLYPIDRYPHGHDNLAISLRNTGDLLATQGSYGEARGYLEQALKMHQALYPVERYPHGHRVLAKTLNSLGYLLATQGAYCEAEPFCRQGVDMRQDLNEILMAATSEAEALNYLFQLPLDRDVLISVYLNVPESDEASYARVWRSKAAVARVLERRQALLFHRAAADPDARREIQAWRDVRGQFARLLLATADGSDQPERLARLQQLTAEKERLERQLATAIPEVARNQPLERGPHTKLVDALPERTVVIDLAKYTRFEQDPEINGEKGMCRTPSYIGFVLAKGRPVRMANLGPAAPIDETVRTWREAITRRQSTPAAEVLRRLVWEPLTRQFASDTTTVVLVLDGSLTAVPWAALPGDKPGTVLLEQYALATVPHAPFLLDRLTAPATTTEDRGILLVVGGVAYDQSPTPADDGKDKVELLAALPAECARGRGDGWSQLPGTLDELNAVTQLAGPRSVSRLQGARAGTAQFLHNLPRARWAHIATHGFFADPSIRSVLRPDPNLFSSMGRERVGAGSRNPLVLSGLVLAGANRPSGDVDGSARDDLGIVTAESIAGLPLQDLELVVLSACETGLGLVGGGEGIFGLQRAFHLAGARNVVASLWRVDDHATAALMAIFYDQLWRQRKPPIEALRTAQLTIYRHPECIGELTKARGTPDFDKLVQRPEPGPDHAPPAPTDRAPIEKWAAFVLSGWGK